MKSFLRSTIEFHLWICLLVAIGAIFYCDMWLTGRLPDDEKLLESVDQRDSSLFEAQLAAGASANARDVSGETVLMRAAAIGELSEVQRLLDLHADINAVDRDGNNALIRAVMGNHPDVVRLLLSRGIDRNHRNRLNISARDAALIYDAREVIATLDGAV